MNAERLLRLAAGLKANAANPTGMKFDLWHWGSFPANQPQPDITCNTVGCAVGFAAVSGIFKKEGLGYKILSGQGIFDESIILPTYKDSEGWQAVNDFFDIEYVDSMKLFSTYSYAPEGEDPRDEDTKGAEAELKVARRIEEYVASHT